jgi:hypothetical protein
MKKLRLFALLAGTLIAGGLLGAWWSARIVFRMQVAKPEVDLAFNTSEEAGWLAGLRLNEEQNVIKDMEHKLNNQLVTMASWESVAPLSGETRKSRDNFLVSAKVYRESYPAEGSDAARIGAFLSTVPGRSPTSTCQSTVCCLDDLRLAKLGGSTNSQ